MFSLRSYQGMTWRCNLDSLRLSPVLCTPGHLLTEEDWNMYAHAVVLLLDTTCYKSPTKTTGCMHHSRQDPSPKIYKTRLSRQTCCRVIWNSSIYIYTDKRSYRHRFHLRKSSAKPVFAFCVLKTWKSVWFGHESNIMGRFPDITSISAIAFMWFCICILSPYFNFLFQQLLSIFSFCFN